MGWLFARGEGGCVATARMPETIEPLSRVCQEPCLSCLAGMEVTNLVVAVLERPGRMPRCLPGPGKTGSVDVSAVRAPQLGLISLLGVWSHLFCFQIFRSKSFATNLSTLVYSTAQVPACCGKFLLFIFRDTLPHICDLRL